MTRLNCTLVLLTTFAVSTCGCSGGKLRNLLSSNEYQTLDELKAEEAGLPGETETQLASADSEKSKSLFRLPGFLGGKDKESAIAPDPFVTASDSESTEETIREYQARIDARLAQKAAQGSNTLADVERQAEQLFQESKAEADQRFSPFADQVAEHVDSAEAVARNVVESSSAAVSEFEAFVAQEKASALNDDGGLLIEPATEKAEAVIAMADESLSEFDRLLQAHENHSSVAPVEQPAPSTDFDSFAGSQMPASEAKDDLADFFGSKATEVVEQSADSDPFAGFAASVAEAEAETEDVWAQLNASEESNVTVADGFPFDTKTSDNAFASADPPSQQLSQPESPFNDRFAEALDQHGFQEDSNPWNSVDAGAQVAMADTEAAFQAESQSPALVIASEQNEDAGLFTEPNGHSDQGAFQSVSQSQAFPSGDSSLNDTSSGLIIPASDSSASGVPFGFEGQTGAVQQISATDLASVPESLATTAAQQPVDLFEDAATTAVQPAPAANGWPRRTWFLILGCVLIAALLFLPERQKR